jgi:hypothetical protein
MFSRIYSQILVVIDDEEFFEAQLPMHLKEVEYIVSVLKRFILVVLSTSRPQLDVTMDEIDAVKPVARLLEQIHERHTRKQFSKDESLWHVNGGEGRLKRSVAH